MTVGGCQRCAGTGLLDSRHKVVALAHLDSRQAAERRSAQGLGGGIEAQSGQKLSRRVAYSLEARHRVGGIGIGRVLHQDGVDVEVIHRGVRHGVEAHVVFALCLGADGFRKLLIAFLIEHRCTKQRVGEELGRVALAPEHLQPLGVERSVGAAGLEAHLVALSAHEVDGRRDEPVVTHRGSAPMVGSRLGGGIPTPSGSVVVGVDDGVEVEVAVEIVEVGHVEGIAQKLFVAQGQCAAAFVVLGCHAIPVGLQLGLGNLLGEGGVGQIPPHPQGVLSRYSRHVVPHTP